MIAPAVAFALAFALGAQEAAPPAPSAPPTAPPVDEPLVVPLAPPPSSTAPAPSSPGTPSTAPPRSKEATPPTKPPQPDAKHDEKQGLDPLPTALLQIATGAGACCVSCAIALAPIYALGLIPVVGFYLGDVFETLFIGTGVGAAEGLVGDAFGQQRAAIAWPIAGAVGTFAVIIAASIIYNLVFPPAMVAQNDPQFEQKLVAYAATQISISAATSVVVVVVPTVVYALTAVDKKPGDTGQGMPGIFAPANPSPPTAKRIVVAMAY